MKNFWRRVSCAVILSAGLNILPVQAADVFVMTNIPVSAEGESAVEARAKAVANGENQAFVELLDKIVAQKDRSKVKISGHDMIVPFVQDVSVANERAGSTRYFGALTVRFKAAPVRDFLESQHVTYLARLPQPALIIPVFKEGSQTLVLEETNPLWEAVRENMPSSRLFQFKLLAGTPEELMPAHAAGVQLNESALKLLAQKYNVTQIMILEVVREGTEFKVSTQFWPKNSAPEAEVSLKVSDDRESLIRICTDLLNDVIRAMSKKWLYLAQNSAQPVQIYPVAAPIEKVSDLSRIRQKLQQLNFADKVDIKGFSNKQLSVDFHYRGTITELGEKLRLNDLILTSTTDANGQMVYLLTEPEAETTSILPE